MESNQCKFCGILAFSICLLFTQGVSATTFISGGVFESQHVSGRSLLQAKTSCPVNFEFQNYTIITSQCKGPTYPAKFCCAAFKEFACPFADQLNDLTNDCASTMFSYINLYGKYPPGLFANECKEVKEGLVCPAQPPSAADSSKASTTNNNSGLMIRNPSPMLMLVAAFLVFVLQLL